MSQVIRLEPTQLEKPKPQIFILDVSQTPTVTEGDLFDSHDKVVVHFINQDSFSHPIQVTAGVTSAWFDKKTDTMTNGTSYTADIPSHSLKIYTFVKESSNSFAIYQL